MSTHNSQETNESHEQRIPILTVDDSLSVEERLTDNTVNNILPARYLDKDEHGNVTETPEELFKRVADNVATAEYLFGQEQELGQEEIENQFEYWRDEFEELMKTQRFIPNSPTLMNAGLRLQQLSACISGDTPIYTRDGITLMENISVGDEVLTHTGEFKEVTAHWSNGEKSVLDVKRGTSRGNNYSVTATPDHEFLNEDREWVELQEADSAAQPTISPDVEAPDSFDLTEYTSVMRKSKSVISDGGAVKVKNTDDPRTPEYDQQYSEVISSVDNNRSFAYLAGAYLAEGDVDGSDLRFTIGADEDKFEEKIVSALSECFDVHVAVMESNYGSWKTITASSPFIAELFITLFGTGSSEKCIPEWVFASSHEYQQTVLDALLQGDAHKSENGWKLTLANPTLAYEASLLARNLGYDVNFTLRAENHLSTNPTSRVHISKKNGKTYMDTITTRESETCEVYDMQVAGDHSFVAGDFIVHNCFVLEPEDDMEDILETVEDAGLIFKSGGGVGYSFSHLRPKGALVSSTKGVSSGPISFMRLFDETCNQVKQGGKRRGAQMAIMRVDHPDIGRFAVCKREEGEFSNFNISAAITDEFKEAVENDEMYTLYSPEHDYDDPFEIVQETAQFYSPEFEDSPETVVDENLWRDHADGISAWDWENEETVSFREKWGDSDHIRLSENDEMQLPARFIWDLLIDGAWRNGEPGLFYLDETNRQHSFDVDEYPDHRIDATNPCFDGSTLLYTDSGMKSAKELYESGNPISVVTDSRMGGERVEEATNVFKTGEKEVYKLYTEEGYSINVTTDHEIMTGDGWVEAQNLTPGDALHILDGKGAFGSGGSKELGEVLGWFVGDGHAKNVEERAVLNFYEDDHELASRFENSVNAVIRDPIKDRDYSVSANQVNRSGNQVMESRIRSERLYELIEEAGLTEDKYQVPDQIFTGSEETVRGFLQALFTADGTVSNYGSTRNVRLSSISKNMLQDVQRLLGNFGIACRIYEERNDAEYERQALHEIHISKSNLETFQSEIGFLRSDKSEQLSAVLDSYSRGPEDENFTATFESLEYLGERPVYDITQPNTNSLIAENINISNCAEQPLEEYEACNLGHINLSLMMNEGAPTYDEWVEAVEYDYHTTGAAAYDYFEEAIDFDQLDRTIQSGTRFLDNVVTQSDFPLDEITERVRNMRKIGLGVMGWAQLLYQMGIRYGSEESFEMSRIVMGYIDKKATQQSHELAKERGNFGEWEDSKYADPTAYPEWFKSHTYRIPENWEDGYPMRNHNVTTVAPTGTTSMIGDTSGGIEPVYSVAYKKNVGNDIQGDEMLVEFDKVFLQTLEANKDQLDHSVDEIKRICARQMDNNEFDGVQGLPIPQWMKETFVTTNDLTSREHGLMQRAFQEAVDSGISKTVNTPSDANHHDVHEAYMLALSDDPLGAPIKGLTVYRDQSREEQVKTTQKYSDLEVENAVEMLQELDGYTVEVEADD